MTSKDLNFPTFSDITVSTKTFTATTNLTIDIKKLFTFLPVTPYIVIPKKRGRKKKGLQPNPNMGIEHGSIITIKCEGELRGVEINPKKNKSGKKKKWFRNSITVVIILDKPINFKVCRNGTFQMTGCKTHEHAEFCVKHLWNYIRDHKDLYTFTRSAPNIEVLFIPSMRNIDFSLGFLVDRGKLNKYMSNLDKFHCLLETSFGYTGVNIKIPLTNDISTMKIKKLQSSEDDWKEKWTTYKEYLDLLGEKERAAKLKAKRYNTFLVFHSGNCIMSGLTKEFMEPVYKYFTGLIRDGYDQIEERLDTTFQGLSMEEELAAMM
jgi:TATA-box binding protein (TBP) (component of TFIID and TFIIIB)